MASLTNSVPVEDRAALDRVFAQSRERPVLLFLYDPYCPVNHRAAKELAGIEEEIAVLDVSRSHELGMEVQERTGVRHESPQLQVLSGGRAVWSASHAAIRALAVTSALHDARQAVTT